MLARTIRYRLALGLSRMRVAYYRCLGVDIGKKCFISSGAHVDVAGGRVSIGSHVNIASGSYILAHTHGQMQELPETILEDGVIVFVNAVVLPGVRVGRNSIVGAGCVVVRDVPPDAVLMGNPARVVEYRSQRT